MLVVGFMKGCGLRTRDMGRGMKGSKMGMYTSDSSSREEHKARAREFGLRQAKSTKESGIKE